MSFSLSLTRYLLELTKVQIEGEKCNGQRNAHARQRGNGIKGQRCYRGHAHLEYPLRNGHLAAVPLDRTTARAAKVEGICGRVVEGYRFEQAALYLVEGRGADAIRPTE